jgi:uncharacterized protein YkwD
MRRALVVLSAILPLFLASCGGSLSGALGGLLEQPDAARPGTVDAEAAARLISQYRADRGLKPLRLDPTLMKLAAEHAQRMASMDRMSHSLPGEGSFASRIAAGGFQASMAAENVAAGQKTLAQVFEAWRKSPGHNANMLLPNVSLMGIAVAVQPGGRYHTYWSLELGERYVPPAGGPMGPGPGPGPTISIGGAQIGR